MNNSGNVLYTREKQLSLTFAGETKNFVLISLAAAGQEEATAAAREIHGDTLAKLSAVEKAVRSAYFLQTGELLQAVILAAEQDEFLKKAALTLSGDEPDYQARTAAKAEQAKAARRLELARLTKEQLADKLTGLEMNRQVQLSWRSAILEATLVQALHGEERQRLFDSVQAMKQALPAEVLDKLCEALLEFLTERGTAQFFLKPHTFKDWIPTPGGMG